MRSIIAILVFCFANLANADDADVRARNALRDALFRHSAALSQDNYGRLRDQALREHRSLIVCVGISDPALEAALPDALHWRTPSFPGVIGPAIVVGRYAAGELWRINLGPSATPSQIRSFLAPTTVAAPVWESPRSLDFICLPNR